ncbi:MAG: hypothetical protein KY454_06880 [Actinobacteria bacterium]|nr:hypothetical protein [Actinomycetota bacterium]MBW3650696.1 hypothetical protein [Actinomycetota bacterium]
MRGPLGPDSGPPQPEAAPSDEELVRLVLRVLAGVVALALALGVAAAATRLSEDEAPRAAPAVDNEPAGVIGPTPGRLVGPYLQARTRALAGARGRRSAVVSFAEYLDERAVRRTLASPGLQVHALLVAPAGGKDAQVPPEGLGSFLRRQREEAREEKRALEELLPTVSDPDFVAQYEQDLVRVTALARWLERPGPVVYGAVVTASADELARLARRPEVRLVDVAATDEVPEAGRARGLRPEEAVSVGEPPERPTPAGSR